MKKMLIECVAFFGLFITANAQWSSNNSNIWTTSSGKRVGVGTNAPTERLQVNGNLKVTGLVKTNTGVYLKSPSVQRFGIHSNSASNGSIGLYQKNSLMGLIDSETTSSGLRRFGLKNFQGKKILWHSQNNWTQIFDGNANAVLTLRKGALGVNTGTIPNGYKLAVAGNIIAEELVIELEGRWPDYVFEQEYDLMPLTEVATYIRENKHLPNIPSAQEQEAKDGISIGEMNKLLLEKIEELTLYTIDQEERLAKIIQELEALKASK